MIKSEQLWPGTYGDIYLSLKILICRNVCKKCSENNCAKSKTSAGLFIKYGAGSTNTCKVARQKLAMVLPLTLLIVLLLLYFNTKSFVNTGIILLALPFSLVGVGAWYLYLAHFNLSVAVWVGIIALLGVSAEMGVVMLLYLEIAYENMKKQGLLTSLEKLKEAIFQGAVSSNSRPVVMTVTVLLLGLLPILNLHLAGSDVMKRIAAPMFGGIITAMIIQLASNPLPYFM